MHQEDLFIEKKYADIKEVKDLKENNENVVRVYCTSYPDGFNLQIKTFKPTLDFSKTAKPRNMIATVNMTIKDMEEILAYMKAEKLPEEKQAATPAVQKAMK